MPRLRAGLARVLLAGALAGAACRGGEAPVPQPAGAQPTPRPREAAYRPPATGELTRVQVASFADARARLAARLSGSQGARPATEPGKIGFAELRQLELDAAGEAGLGSEEYLWVKERVLEAEAADVTAELNANALGMLERTLEGLRGRRAAAADDGSRSLIDDQIHAFESEAARIRAEAAEKEPPHVDANRRVVRSFRGKLTALREEIERAVPRPSLSPPRS